MKKSFLLLVFINTLAFGFNDKSPSTIKTVTVYLNGAQVVRTANLSLLEGSNEIVLDGLSPYIQESSIQVSGLNDVSIMSITYTINHLSKNDFSKEIKDIQDKISALKDNIQMEDNIMAGYQEELQLIKANRSLGNEQDVVNLEKLKSFSEYYRKQLTYINNQIFESQKKQKLYQDEIDDLVKQLSEFKIDEKVQTGEITLKLNAKTNEKLTLEIIYNVSRAGWFPVYDLNAEKINEPLKLVYKAHVYQNTGVEWENVKLALSNSDPTTNNLKPVLTPKYLNFVNRFTRSNPQNATNRYDYAYNPTIKTVTGIILDESGAPLPGVNVIVKGTSVGTQTDFDGKYSLQVENGKELTFSYLGYISETLPVHSSIMNLSLTEDSNILEEVVVTAYGSKREQKSNGSAVSVESFLQGKVAGLQVENETGIKIRGIASLTKNSQPLYIVDGVIVNEKDVRYLDPQTIVQKNSEAIYGSRATEGVIVIKTKTQTSTGAVVEEGITNLRIEIKDLYTIKTEEDVTVIEIETYSVPAEYTHFAAPVLNENVFLMAKLSNWEQYNLLPGEASVYFEGSYSGKTMLNPFEVKDTLTISLGVDPNVIVKRNELKDYKSKPFIGTNRILDKAYEIEIRNNKKTNISLVLMDRIPVSQNKDIKVEDVKTGNSEYDEEKGLMTWKLSLSPSERDKKTFSYQLRFPKYKSISL